MKMTVDTLVYVYINKQNKQTNKTQKTTSRVLNFFPFVSILITAKTTAMKMLTKKKKSIDKRVFFSGNR